MKYNFFLKQLLLLQPNILDYWCIRTKHVRPYSPWISGMLISKTQAITGVFSFLSILLQLFLPLIITFISLIIVQFRILFYQLVFISFTFLLFYASGCIFSILRVPFSDIFDNAFLSCCFKYIIIWLNPMCYKYKV